jgi:hypothetical protein
VEIEHATLLALAILASGAASCAWTSLDAEKAAETAPNPPSTSTPASAANIEALAKETLGKYLSRPVEEIELVSVVPIDWPDSSVGCPRPDREYLQVITPGHYAVLRHAGTTYRVHMAEGRAFVCDRPAGEVPPDKRPAPKLAIPLEHLKTLARADLARRLGVAVEEVSLTRTESVVWPDTSLGCPEPGQTYQPEAAKGFVLEYSCRGRSFAYHTDRFRLLPCPPVEVK